MSSSTTPVATLNAGAATGTAIALSIIMILTFFIYFMSGSGLAVIVFWLVLVLAAVVMWTYGLIDIGTTAKVAASSVQPATRGSTNPLGDGSQQAIVGGEVFHVNDGAFTYDDAPAVCAAYGANLATLEQVNDAYNNGAEWCGYGWSVGGLALYPTQRSTWEVLQQEVDPAKRTACGRIGVNGGYFDPASKFGVNCYGYKPAMTSNTILPAPAPGTDSSAFQAAVNNFKGMLSTLTISPYSRQQWSGYGALGSNAYAAANYGNQFTQNLGGLGGGSRRASVAGGTTENFTMEKMTVAPTDANFLNNRPSGYVAIEQGGIVNIQGGTGGYRGHGSDPRDEEAVIGPTGPKGDRGEPGPTGMAGRDAAPVVSEATQAQLNGIWRQTHAAVQNVANYALGTRKGVAGDACLSGLDCSGNMACSSNKCA